MHSMARGTLFADDYDDDDGRQFNNPPKYFFLHMIAYSFRLY